MNVYLYSDTYVVRYRILLVYHSILIGILVYVRMYVCMYIRTYLHTLMYQAVCTYVGTVVCDLCSFSKERLLMTVAHVRPSVRMLIPHNMLLGFLMIEVQSNAVSPSPLKDFAATREEKKAFLDQANADFDALMADPSTRDLVPAPLAAQHDLANKHWEDLCKRQDMEEQAEQVCVRVCVCMC